MPAPLVPTGTPGIYKRGSRYAVRVTGPGGRVIQRSARNITEARALKASLRADVDRGEYRAVSRAMFAEYAAQWLETYTGRTARGLRAGTLADYKRDLERWAIPFFGRARLAEIDPPGVKRFAKRLADSGLSPASVRRVTAPLKALFATAYEEGAIRSNPTQGVRVAANGNHAGGEEEHVRALSEEELGRLLQETPGEWRLLVRFLAETGLRIGECIALRWEHIDLGQRRLSVRERLYKGETDKPKSRFGQRDVPLSPGLAQALWRHRGGSRFNADGDPVFASRTGTPLKPENVSRRVLKPAAERAGVPWAAFHTLRHTAASRMFRAGWNAKQVQVVLGHHSPAFTLATYVHLMPTDLPDASFFDGLAGDVAVNEGSQQVGEGFDGAGSAEGAS